MMKKIALMTALAFLQACTSIQVTRDWDPNFDFSAFETFVILDNAEPQGDPFTDDRICKAIAANLEDKGFLRVKSQGNADFAVGYQLTTDERRTYQTVHSGWNTNSFRHNNQAMWGMSTGASTTRERVYTIGTIVIPVYHMSDKLLVWEASGSKTLSATNDPERAEQRIVDKVTKIMETFPP